ncbi:MAG: UDP-N-acetylmuramoyl-tripeptide--D-alanyl-D-alanine ligase [Bacteroidales bacterium]|nr:UDP-N-acetylmuramoyl-tripeptide--D-alanyl-D-alanine ligase [Bacteroidales bacterium]
MKNLSLANIAMAAGGRYVGSAEMQAVEVTAIESDSRKVPEGGLFVAIKGERVDGHKFIDQVIAGGAAAVLSEVDLGEKPFPYILVPSTLQAVKDIAEFYLKGLNIPVIGIAGSVGKTSTKEMTHSVLRQKYNVLKTEGNFNNELGLPLTIFRLRDEHEMAVLEMGISDFGEMHRLAKVARPNTVIMTNIGICHIERLGDRDGILKAKSEIFDFIEPGANIILNGDDDKLATVTDVRGIKPVYFGFNAEHPIWADNLQSLGLKGTICTIHTPQGSFDAHVGLPGRHQVLNALAGTAAGLAYGLSLEQIKAGIEANGSLAGRFHIIDTPRYTIIDDCYNANPVSMRASLEVLQDGAGRRVAIIGDMGELGDDKVAHHAELGKFAAALNIDVIYCVGPLSEAVAEEAKKCDPTKEVRHFPTLEAIIEALPSLMKQGDTILVKASHYMKFSEIVAHLQK